MNMFEIAAVVGCFLALLFVLCYILTWVGQWIWGYIDDSDCSSRNKLIEFIMTKLMSYEVYDVGWLYRSGDKLSDGGEGFFLTFFTLLFLPILIVAAIKLYLVTIVLCVILGVVQLARFSRRLKKKFDIHTEDKSAHK